MSETQEEIIKTTRKNAKTVKRFHHRRGVFYHIYEHGRLVNIVGDPTDDEKSSPYANGGIFDVKDV
ncbi:MAG: hypothetical protein U9N35_05050 [Euryarchaeota archaeon]|nr:hypothetical protein [Euryarchaeota archaeon]